MLCYYNAFHENTRDGPLKFNLGAYCMNEDSVPCWERSVQSIMGNKAPFREEYWQSVL